MTSPTPCAGASSATVRVARLALHKETVRSLAGSRADEQRAGAAGHTQNHTCTCQPYGLVRRPLRAPTCAACPSAVCT